MNRPEVDAVFWVGLGDGVPINGDATFVTLNGQQQPHCFFEVDARATGHVAVHSTDGFHHVQCAGLFPGEGQYGVLAARRPSNASGG